MTPSAVAPIYESNRSLEFVHGSAPMCFCSPSELYLTNAHDAPQFFRVLFPLSAISFATIKFTLLIEIRDVRLRLGCDGKSGLVGPRNGKPVVRLGRKAMGLRSKIARLPNGY